MVKHHKQRGIALITILMILAIMVTIAATMTGRMTSSLLRTEGLSYSEKVYWYGQATVDFSRMVLEDDFADSEVISLDQIWATPDIVFPVDEGSITGNMVDYRRCFNINAIAQADQDDTRALPISQFQILLISLGVEEYAAEIIAESTRDWLDNNDTVDVSQGAEDRYYESVGVPHLTANHLMVDVSELRAIQGVTDQIYERIKPFLCALPASNQLINVNTVNKKQPQILFALFPPELLITIEDIQSILDDRPISGWASVDEFLASELIADKLIPDVISSQLSVTSDFFQLFGLAEFDQRVMVFKLLFKVENKKATTIRFQYAGVEEVVGMEMFK
ncbi:type II secretion system minor pseudopilin GspK [Psychromonas arctica]|uniref:type II secretion system minor pseudopilin GspK n=1 Tax=Psychromonas arctica TaxID=168275 RepID=UPI000413BC92|nr:type II secretion system minor pseudopilin GspK [Psychromonas arctica]